MHSAQCALPPIQRLSVLCVWQTSVHNQAIIIAAATQQPSFPTSHLKWKHRAHVVLGHSGTYSLFEEKIISQPPKVHIWNDQVSVSLIFSQVLLVTSFIYLHRQGPQCWQRPFQAWHRSIPWSLIDQSRVITWLSHDVQWYATLELCPIKAEKKPSKMQSWVLKCEWSWDIRTGGSKAWLLMRSQQPILLIPILVKSCPLSLTLTSTSLIFVFNF